MLAHVCTTDSLFRYYLTGDVSAGFASPDSLAALEVTLRSTDPDDQRSLLARLGRPLGKRSDPRALCGGLGVPHPERFDILWAVCYNDLKGFGSPDEVRDSLGLTHLRPFFKIVAFNYLLPGGVSARIPTAIEALGSWAYWPATATEAQRTMNYRTGKLGPEEFVHEAVIPPDTMRYEWVGEISGNWDD
jgi:hypothetical protein